MKNECVLLKSEGEARQRQSAESDRCVAACIARRGRRGGFSSRRGGGGSRSDGGGSGDSYGGDIGDRYDRCEGVNGGGWGSGRR